jgi:hypothetical protein
MTFQASIRETVIKIFNAWILLTLDPCGLPLTWDEAVQPCERTAR